MAKSLRFDSALGEGIARPCRLPAKASSVREDAPRPCSICAADRCSVRPVQRFARDASIRACPSFR